MIVAPTAHGARLDKALAQALPEFSRSYLQQLIEGGAVDVNGLAVVRPSARLKAGDSVGVCLRPTAQSQAFKAQAMDLRVVFEDAHLLVIDKPAGLVVHPAPGNWSGTLLNGLLAYHSDFAELPRAGIVHRLDKDTSGLMLVARTRQSMDTLVQMIAARSVQPKAARGAGRHRSGSPQSLAHGSGRSRARLWQGGAHQRRSLAGVRTGLPGTLHAAHRPDPPDSRAYGPHRPSAGGRRGLRRRPGGGIGATGPACLQAGVAAPGKRRAAGIRFRATTRPGQRPSAMGPAVQFGLIIPGLPSAGEPDRSLGRRFTLSAAPSLHFTDLHPGGAKPAMARP